ncbi:hypothetical protein ACFFNY_13205 [Paenibacillus hodogayensis]|uniref:Carboxypeptidase regulatory-like domain-containing protein n=1 Tax=Paenibacillus hodogayensis TaxID=279208 RepID=A0ABV5VW24_9BACL
MLGWKLKIKVKQLVLSVVAIGIVIPLLTEYVAPQARLYNARKLAAAHDSLGREGILEALGGKAIVAKQRWGLIRDYMIEDAPDKVRASDFDLYIGPNFSQYQNGSQKELFSREDKIPYLEQYVGQAPVNGYLVRSAEYLAYLLQEEGETDRAVAVLEQAAKRLAGDRYETMRHELVYRAAGVRADEGRGEEAEAMLAALSLKLTGIENDLNDRIAKRRARIAVDSGKLIPVLEGLKAELARTETAVGTDGSGDSPQRQQLIRMKTHLESEAARRQSSASAVSGSVLRSDGTPIAHAGVYLRDERIVNQSVQENDPYQGMTDEHGAFRFQHVEPGNYQLYLGLDFDQISGWTWPVVRDDWIEVDGSGNVRVPVTMQRLIEQLSPVKEATIGEGDIEFQWKEVEGAAFYTVMIGTEIRNGTAGMQLRTGIPEPRLRVPAQALYDVQTGLSYETPGDWSSTDPSTLLGFTNPDSRLFWTVEAYSGSGELLTKSNGYRLDDGSVGNPPFFYVKQRSMTAADKLVQAGRFDDALAGYMRELEAEPEPVHSLRMLVRLLQAKSWVTDDKTYGEQALPYLTRLVELHPAPMYVSALRGDAYEKRDWPRYDRMLALYDRVTGLPPTPYDQSMHGTALMMQGRYAEALPVLAEAVSADRSHRFVGNYLAAVLYTEQSARNASLLAGMYPERAFGPPIRNWKNLVDDLAAEAKENPAYYARLNEVLDWHFQGEAGPLRSWLLDTGDSAMKAFVQGVMGVK